MKLEKSNSWYKYLANEMEQAYFKNLTQFLVEERSKKEIYPAENQVFNALKLTSLENVRVVILGQDPYHGPNQAHGLAFSVNEGIKLPPSLVNIYKELASDTGLAPRQSGDLSHWASQGVLLLNDTLTVEKSKAGAHQKKGWEQFTKKIIELVNEHCENVVFILWGAPAQKKAKFVNRQKHLVLESPHPSPLSSYRGFFGSSPFSKANKYLKDHGKQAINW